MPIVAAAYVPHTPLLIPAVGKQNLARIRTTLAAYEKIAAHLAAEEVQTLIIITPHARLDPAKILFNAGPLLAADFEEFGDYGTKLEARADVGLAYRLHEELEAAGWLAPTGENRLDHGVSVPLFYLDPGKKMKIVSLACAGAGLAEHFRYGQALKTLFQSDQRRIAVIGSGELSHRLTKNAPAGYSPRAKKFDQKIREAVMAKDTNALLGLDHDLVAEAEECGLKSLVFLFGAVDRMNCQPVILSYEAPFGVGYLTVDFGFG